MFITFEGGEGCGKSTHAKLLSRYLKKLGHKVLLTREPGGTRIGKKIRALLLMGKGALPRQTEFFLFLADRVMHVDQVIKPALNKGVIVISDRYVDSSIAYQSGGRGLPKKMVQYLNSVSSGGLMPDVTFYLDLPFQQALKRMHVRSRELDRFEREKVAFHRRIRETFLKIAKTDNNRMLVIRPTGKITAVQAKIRKVILRKIDEK